MDQMLPAVVDAAQVAELLERRPDLVLLDVLPDAYYVRRHICGARNACVYKMAFLDDVAKLVPGRETPLIVYGDRPDSRASAVARDKLLAAGYRQVADFSTGLSAWRAAGGPTEGSGGEPEQDQPSPDGRHRLDPDKSSLRWFGRNLGSTHHGTLPLVEGDCTVERGRLRGACVVFDMTGIRCEDLTDRSTAEILEAHLRSDDFFDVERYPQATFSVTRAEPIPGAAPGTPDTLFHGELALKGRSGELSFAGSTGRKDGHLVVRAALSFDRTRWNVLYGSGSFFEKLGMHLVDDQVGLEFRLLFKQLG